MTAPTEEQLLMLNSILYLGDFPTHVSVYTWANSYRPTEAKAEMSVEDQQRLIDTVLAQPDVYKSITFQAVEQEHVGNGTITNAAFDYNGDTIIAYKGTGGDMEWRDNGVGGYASVTDTPQQQAALDFFDHWAGQGAVYVTGHSKGGNKAQYVTLMRGDQVIHAYSFDGQGFNAAFCLKYQDQIAQYGGKITSLSNQNDFVNILFNRVAGDIRFVNSSTDALWDFKKWHSPFSMFQVNNGHVSLASAANQSATMAGLEDLLRFYEQHMSAEDFRYLCYSVMSFLMDDDAYGENYGEMPPGFWGRFAQLTKNYAENKGLDPYDVFKLVQPLGQAMGLPGLGIGLAIAYAATPSAGYASVPRDFTDATKQRLLAIVDEVNNESFWDIGRWDCWYRVEKFFGGVDFPATSAGLNDYYRKMIDMKGVSRERIEEIFKNVAAAETEFQVQMTAVNQQSQIIRTLLQGLIA